MIINSNLTESPVVLKCPLWSALFYKNQGRLPTREEAQLAGYTYAAYYNCMKRKAYVRYLSEFGFNTEK